MNTHVNIFAIVVTYKGTQWYDRCFESLQASALPVRVIAVDNSPGDEDAEYIKTHFPEVHVIKTNENLGFGRANNLGMRFALDHDCDYVFLLNQDAWLDNSDSLSKLVAIAEKNPEYGIVSPIHLNADRTAINMMIGLGAHHRNERLLSDLYLNRVGDIYETNYVNAAAWLLPRKTLETVGGFDPLFRHYEEDDNYLNRVLYHGLKIGICPGARIIHDHHDTNLSDENLLYRQQQYLLVDWTNINVPFSVKGIMRFYIRKWMKYTLKFDCKNRKRIQNEMKYCLTMRKQVMRSRAFNKMKQPSWLKN